MSTSVPQIRLIDDIEYGGEFSINETVQQPEYEIYTPVSYDIWSGMLECRNRAGVIRKFDPFRPVYVVKECGK